MEMNFCRRCGAELTTKGKDYFQCSNGHPIFRNPAPTTSAFLITPENQVALGVRAHNPFKGMLDSIGGFIDINETIEEALAREIQEETGLTPDLYEQPTYLVSSVAPYPYKGEDITIFTMMYVVRLKPGAKVIPGDDIAEVVVRDIPSVDPSEFGAKDVQDGMRALQQLFAEGEL